MRKFITLFVLVVPMLGLGQEDKIFIYPDSLNYLRANEIRLTEFPNFMDGRNTRKELDDFFNSRRPSLYMEDTIPFRTDSIFYLHSGNPNEVFVFDTDTLLIQPIFEFEVYESLSCTVHSYLLPTHAMRGISLWRTVYTRIGRDGDWIPGPREFVLLEDEDGVRMEFDMEGSIIHIKTDGTW